MSSKNHPDVCFEIFPAESQEHTHCLLALGKPAQGKVHFLVIGLTGILEEMTGISQSNSSTFLAAWPLFTLRVMTPYFCI